MLCKGDVCIIPPNSFAFGARWNILVFPEMSYARVWEKARTPALAFWGRTQGFWNSASFPSPLTKSPLAIDQRAFCLFLALQYNSTIQPLRRANARTWSTVNPRRCLSFGAHRLIRPLALTSAPATKSLVGNMTESGINLRVADLAKRLSSRG